MRELTHRAVLAQQASSLPALIAQCEDIARYVGLFEGLVEKDLYLPASWSAADWDGAQLKTARQALAQLPQMQRAWAALSRPASADEITGQIALLVATFPNLSRTDLRHFARLLRHEIATERPSRYVLIRASRELRRRYEFLSIKSVIKMIEQERRRARKVDYLIRSMPLAELVARADENKRRAEEAARKREAEERAEQRAELEWLAEKCPPDLCPSAYDDAELALLRLRRAELLAWRKKIIAGHPELRRDLIELDQQAAAWRALWES